MTTDGPTHTLVPPRSPALGSAFGRPRDFLGNRFVYVVISPRVRGLSIGINLNPDRHCNFNCCYCEVDRSQPPTESVLDLTVMAEELRRTLQLVRSGEIRSRPGFDAVPDALLELRHVTLSGDGEPTLCPVFAEAVQETLHVRARREAFFKVALITNASSLHLPEVQAGLRYFTRDDEIWAKLDAGTPAYMQRVNGTDFPLEQILRNILHLARQRPVIIQSLFPAIHRMEPSAEEIGHYARRLAELKKEGAQISLVQIHSATRPAPRSECTHLPLKTLFVIAQQVRQLTGLKVEVF